MEGIGQLLEHWGANIPEDDFNFGIRLFFQLNPKNSMEEPKIDLKEFVRECTYFAIKVGFDKPKPLPTRPRKLIDYDVRKAGDRGYEVRESFWREPEIWAYVEQKSKIQNINRGNLAWLKETLTRLEKYSDTNNIQIIRNRIQEFEDSEYL